MEPPETVEIAIIESIRDFPPILMESMYDRTPKWNVAALYPPPDNVRATFSLLHDVLSIINVLIRFNI